mmetsp:Transcript_13823/g.21690  ORF Transcript_13823/g.21690 Transcript_13823/m.21690 type:complete len:345 (-) Transcript_13823:445-1479(-)
MLLFLISIIICKHLSTGRGALSQDVVGRGGHRGQQGRPAEPAQALRRPVELGGHGRRAEPGGGAPRRAAGLLAAHLLAQVGEVADRLQPLLGVEQLVGDQGLAAGVVLEPIVPLHHQLLPQALPPAFGGLDGLQAGPGEQLHGGGGVPPFQQLQGLHFQLDLGAHQRALHLGLRPGHVRGDVPVEAPHVVPDARAHPEEGVGGVLEERAVGEGPGQLGHGHVEGHEEGGLGVVGGQPEVRADLAGQLAPGRGDDGGGSPVHGHGALEETLLPVLGREAAVVAGVEVEAVGRAVGPGGGALGQVERRPLKGVPVHGHQELGGDRLVRLHSPGPGVQGLVRVRGQL